MANGRKTNVIIDSDPGVDDSLALSFALNSPVLNVKLVAITQGNVPVSVAKKNALYLLELFGLTNIPVAVGRRKALIREYHDASVIHGKTGMGKYRKRFVPKTLEIAGAAHDAMYEKICEYPQNITIVALGPLTNIALLIQKYPDAGKKISEIVFMSGSLFGKGNTNEWAEFNAFVDPEALQIVLDSGIPMTMLPMEIGGQKSRFYEDDILRMAKLNKTGQMFSKMLLGYRVPGQTVMGSSSHDICAVFYLLDPKMFTTKRAFVNVDVNEFPGRTIMNWHEHGAVKVINEINLERFYNFFFEELKKIKY